MKVENIAVSHLDILSSEKCIKIMDGFKMQNNEY